MLGLALPNLIPSTYKKIPQDISGGLLDKSDYL